MPAPHPAAASPSERLATVDDLLLYRMAQVSAKAGALVVKLCEGGHGITRREWAVLAQLHQHPEGLPPSQLAEHMLRDRARTSRSLTALRAKGLVQRQTLPHDRRSARVALTPQGQTLYTQLMPKVQAINAQLLSALSAEEKRLLDLVLDRLREAAGTMLADLAPSLPMADRRRAHRPRS